MTMHNAPNAHNKPGSQTDYVPFAPETLLPGTAAPFPVYLRRERGFVLYCEGGDKFGPGHRTRLAELGHQEVYVAAERRRAYELYLRRNMPDLLTDGSIPPERRAALWSDSLSGLVLEFFETTLDPALAREHLRHLERIVTNAARFFADPGALARLARFIAQAGDEYDHGVGTMVYTCCLMRTVTGHELLLTSCGIGALLHDVGRTRLPRDLVNKDPDLFDESERTIFASHPAIAVGMCAPIPLLPEAMQCILMHHERPDGRGFPSGAAGEDIPVHGRAVALANAYDTLTRPQPWRPGLPPFEALSQIRDDPGGYDQDLFRSLVTLLAREGLTTEI